MWEREVFLREFEEFEFDKDLLFLIPDSPDLQKCVINANASSHKPYLPWKTRYADIYKRLTPEQRTKINIQTDQIFQSPNVRGPSPQLNPKNPHHMPYIRVWLRIRDCVLSQYYFKNKGTSLPGFTNMLNDYLSYMRQLFTEYDEALSKVESNFKAEFPHDVDLMYVLRKNWMEYAGEAYHSITEGFEFPPFTGQMHAMGGFVQLFTKMMNDYKDELEKNKAIKENRELTEDILYFKDEAKVVLSNFERTLNESRPELERDYNGLSEYEKTQFYMTTFVTKPIKTSLEFEAEFYFDLINRLEGGYIQISLSLQIVDIAPIGQPRDETLPLHLDAFNISKVKVVAPKFARHIASGLDRLKESFVKIKNLDDQFNNLFEWAVRKRLFVTYTSPYLPYMTFARHFIKSKGSTTSYALQESVLPPLHQKVWKSMVKPGSEELYQIVFLKDYVKQAFVLNKIQNLVIEFEESK